MPPKPTDIINMVEAQVGHREDLRERMEQDLRRYFLEPFKGSDDEDEDYKKYTSNDPRTYADKVINLLVDSNLVISIPAEDSLEEQRDADIAKERFVIGALKAADERIVRLVLPRIKDQMAFYSTIRGWLAGRALLRKKKDGGTEVDITPWDPMHVFYEPGSDGLAWACHRIRKTRAAIRAEYNLGPRFKLPGDEEAAGGGEDHGLLLYDYYYPDGNIVFVEEGKVIKRDTPHGATRTPVWIGMAGTMPPIQSKESRDPEQHDLDTISGQGESIYAADRRIYEQQNFVMTALLEFVARSRKPTILITSRDGTKVLQEDPRVSGSDISLAEGDKIEYLDQQQLAAETSAFMGLLSGELQRGALPNSAFGELQFQLSGFAINSLAQGIGTVMRSSLALMETAYKQIGDLLVDQYVEGSFTALEVSGRDRGRKYFRATIEPEVVEKGGELEYKLFSQLPKDDVARVTMAHGLREGPVPLASDRHIRAEVLQFQDADLMEADVKAELAEKGLPEATLYTLMLAAADRGEEQIAKFYMAELLQLLIQKGRQAQGLVPPQQPGGAGTPPGAPGVPPQAAPPQALGIPQPAPVPQVGPIVAPGTPRPGAQQQPFSEPRRPVGV